MASSNTPIRKFQSLILFSLAVCFGFGLRTVNCAKCDTEGINNCTAGMGSFDFSDTGKTCESLQDMEKCLKSQSRFCEMDASQMTLKTNSLAHIRQTIKSICSMIKNTDKCYDNAEACMSPLEQAVNKTIKAADKICPVIMEASKCLKGLFPTCGNEQIKEDIKLSSNGFVELGHRYNCKKAGYTITDVSDNGEVLLQSTVAIFLSSFLVIVFTN